MGYGMYVDKDGNIVQAYRFLGLGLDSEPIIPAGSFKIILDYTEQGLPIMGLVIPCRMALKLAKEGDWVVFDDHNQICNWRVYTHKEFRAKYERYTG